MKRTPLKRKPYKLKRSRLRRKSRNPISKLKDKLWRVFSLYIRYRDKHKCFTCGKRSYGRTMHAGHFISRKVNSTFVDPINVHAQCAGCNMFLYGNSPEYAQRLITKYGLEEFEALIARGRKTWQWTEKTLQELMDILEEEPEQYKTKYYQIVK